MIPLKVSFVLTSELIDTLWNVNENIKRIFLLDVLELIDTLWNVNTVIYKVPEVKKKELIDTLWNVNNVTATL